MYAQSQKIGKTMNNKVFPTRKPIWPQQDKDNRLGLPICDGEEP